MDGFNAHNKGPKRLFEFFSSIKTVDFGGIIETEGKSADY